jgi:hypothetical protein
VKTISAILEADADGPSRLPLPVELRKSKVKVMATVQDIREFTIALWRNELKLAKDREIT